VVNFAPVESLTLAPSAPRVPFLGLSTLWFQITGFLCNLECEHCLVAAGPRNRALNVLSLEEIQRHLEEAERLGVKEVYFTGGEPFIHRQILRVLQLSLAVAPTTVLTNGTLIHERMADGISRVAELSRNTLEIRVSLDSPDEAENDRVRGRGAFAKALRAITLLDQRGMLPILTATEYCLPSAAARSAPVRAHNGSPRGETAEGEPPLLRRADPGPGIGVYACFRDLLLAHGVRRPRVKILPVFATGRLEGDRAEGRLTTEHLREYDVSYLQCTECRVVASNGLYLCPILVNLPEARLSARTLSEATDPVPLAHHACTTCYVRGASCKNY
jgi:hypothetical protein